MSIIPLTYLPKRYKVVPFTNHKLKTHRNIADSDTFLTCTGTGCDAELLKRPVIVKICKKTDVKDYCTEFAMKIEEVTKLDTIIQMMVLFLEDLESINNAS